MDDLDFGNWDFVDLYVNVLNFKIKSFAVKLDVFTHFAVSLFSQMGANH